MEENKKNKAYEFVLLERLENKVDVLLEEQKEIKEKVDKIDLLVEDMDYVKSEIVEIKDRFKENDNSMNKKADNEIVKDHEIRITKLEDAPMAKAA